MPFAYTTVEDEVAEKLRAYITQSSLTDKVAVQAMPDSEEEFIEGDEKERIIIYVFSATAGPSKSTNEKTVAEDIIISCNLQSRSRRGNADYIGCNGLAELVKTALTGYEPSHCGRLLWKNYQASNPPRDADKNFWSYDLDFSTTKLFVQSLQDAEDYEGSPLLEQVIINDQVQLP